MASSFFCRQTAKSIWKSVVGVSSAGSKRGRGKGVGRNTIKDFNRGQQIGVGRRQLILPGLNTRPVSGRRFNDIEDVGPNEKFQDEIVKFREEMNVRKKFREAPIDRGWSGKKAHGRHAGPPDDYNETKFENFNSTVLMLRPLFGMSGVMGRTRRMQALVVVGNQNGLAGFATAIGNDPKSAVRHARNIAGQSLIKVPISEGHTVMHDFYSKYHYTTVFVERKPRGHGIRAHRVIAAICERFGITDLYAKVEGNERDQINMTKAFFLGLFNQRSYQEMAEEKQLHLVDIREENYFYPHVLASPSQGVRDDSHVKRSGENLDFTYFIYEGKIRQVKSQPKSSFEDHPMYYKHLDRKDLLGNRERVKLSTATRYGDTRVLDVFPYFRSNAESFREPKDS